MPDGHFGSNNYLKLDYYNNRFSAGDLKVVSVVEGGKAAVTKLTLSTDPFKTYDISSSQAIVEPHTGILKFYYGLIPSQEFNAGTVLQNVNDALQSSATLPEGYFLGESAISRTYVDMLPELNVEGCYFWIIPVLYSDGENAGYYIEEDMLRVVSFLPISASINVGDVSLLDAEVQVNIVGTTSAYAGIALNSETALSEIIYQIKNGVLEPVPSTEVLTYNGPASGFPTESSAIALKPATSYIAWIIPVDNGKEEYAVTDIVYSEFTTLEIQSGGSLTVTVEEPVADNNSISVAMTAPDAEMIYYGFLDESTGSRYSGSTISNETKMKYLMSSDSFNFVHGTSAEALIDHLLPETTMWMYAVAIDKYGKYGDVKCVSAMTAAVTFNSLTVTIKEDNIGTDEASFLISVTGGTATDYVYWVGRKSDDFWKSSSICNESKTQAAKYIAANPDADAIVKVMKQNGSVGEDGILKITDLSIAKDHVILVAAKDETGNYSKCGYKSFTTKSISLGDDYVAEGTDKWNTTKAWIEENIDWDEDYFAGSASSMGYAEYAFSIKIPTDLTAYIDCFGTEATDKVDIIVEIETYCSRSVSASRVTKDADGNDVMHPDWYDDNGKLIQGSMLNVYTMYAHGDPNQGAVTYFATNGHDGHCPAWTSGECANYEEYQSTIDKYLSLDYWKEYLREFGNYWYNNDPNHAYSRTLKDENRITEIAQQYLDLYTPYYKDAEPVYYVNDGEGLRVLNRNATGLNDEGKVMDKVTVVLKDLNGNYYDPMYIEVPNYFK